MELADRPAALAVELAQAGAVFTVVGGAARRLRGLAHEPLDLDLVVAPEHVAQLHAALVGLGASVPRRLRSAVRTETSWGPVDVFVGEVPETRTCWFDGYPLKVPA